jgi:mRNA-degrading endonuclease RelE of RelBE toxin-antitoxin system
VDGGSDPVEPLRDDPVMQRGHVTEDLERLETTSDVLSDAQAMAGIREADAAVARAEVLRGVDAVRRIPPSVTHPYEPVVAAPWARAIAEELPEPVAHADIDLITGPVLEGEHPYRIGRELRRELQGVFAARRGTYRVLHRIDEARREVAVIRIDPVATCTAVEPRVGISRG